VEEQQPVLQLGFWDTAPTGLSLIQAVTWLLAGLGQVALVTLGSTLALPWASVSSSLRLLRVCYLRDHGDRALPNSDGIWSLTHKSLRTHCLPGTGVTQIT
jgi:hypothetical protein